MSESLTKAQKEQIKKLILEALGSTETGEDKRKEMPGFDKWKENSIITDSGIEIAPEDLYVGDKKFFTWDEANEILKNTDWRLPTAAEWMMICGELGVDESGVVTAEQLEKNLGLKMNGWVYNMDKYNKGYPNSSIENVGTNGYYWSASATTTAANAYTLYFTSGGVYPQGSTSKLDGFSIRCVARSIADNRPLG